jgi:hypothetical protein
MSHHDIAWPAQPAPSSSRAARQSSGVSAPPAWLTSGLLALASSVLLALAGASAWLSYGAQVSYVLAHNGNMKAEANVWALLLDAGTAGVSLLRLYETLRRRPGPATRASLLGCIAASVTMNLLHCASHSPGGYLVATVPPVMYAVFLEHLLANLRSLLMAGEERRSTRRALAMWINFPTLMWSRWRNSLRHDAEALQAVPGTALCAVNPPQCAIAGVGLRDKEVEHPIAAVTADESGTKAAARRLRRGRGPGPKRVAFEAALMDQVRAGDVRLFSDDERERNAAAYQAAASLPAPLSRGTARRYVVQALPRLESTGAARRLTVLEDAQDATGPS